MARQPNYVFIFADDWGWGDLGCYGHDTIRTPHLDRLASEGRLFTQFYVCSGVCSPSRSAVMTGRFPARDRIHGHLSEHEMNRRRGMPDWLDPGAVTYTRLLQQTGYRVGHFGKWHLGNGPGAPEPSAYGIDESFVNAGEGPQLEFARERWAPGLRIRSSEFIVNHAIRFIERHRDRPFLVNAWLNDTHAILDPTREQLESYRDTGPAARRLPGGHRDLLRHRHRGGLPDRTPARAPRRARPGRRHGGDLFLRQRAGGHPGAQRRAQRGGQRRTVPRPQAQPVRGWSAGAVHPALACGRGARAARWDDATPLCAVDLLPTFCRLAGVEPPSPLELDGEDMSDVFAGATRERRTPLLWEWRFRIVGHVLNRSPMLALREGPWKLLVNPDRDRPELYHVPSDPMELDNRAPRRACAGGPVGRPRALLAAGTARGPWSIPTPAANTYPWPRSQQR